MAIFFDAPVTPDVLTDFVRLVPTPSNLALSQLFPTRYLDSNTIDFAEIVRTNRTAKYRSFDGRIHVSERDTGSEKRVGLAALSSSLTIGEYERLQLEFARTSGTNSAALAAAVYNDGTNLTVELLNRGEMSWGDVLTDGVFSPPEGPGISDYGLPPSQMVTAGTLWSNTSTSTPLTDLLTWSDTMVTNNGAAPASMLTSLRMQRLMQKNAEVINAVYGSSAGKTRVTITELNDLLGSEGLPVLRPAYDTQLDVDEVATRPIADNKVILLPSNLADLGYFAYGVSATALELMGANQSDLSFEEAPGIVGVVIKSGPPFRQAVFVDAVGQPVLHGAKLMLVATAA